eukprot:TRINITY_DN13719_c0_g2_i1.p1 TRINITY_DN13719_c0_g2~~TRINITY_DN13719_c0_g2_i1.p1  ORF type:complete len:502 (-),score=82.74 TRINITY_DN13719_c0_g2_i1:116-1504(-)
MYTHCEQEVEKSNISSSIVRYEQEFQNSYMTGTVPRILLQRVLLLPLLNEKVSWVDMRDVVEAICRLLLQPIETTFRVYEICGAEQLSGPEMALVISQVLKERVQFISFPHQGKITDIGIIEEKRTGHLQQILMRQPTSFLEWTSHKYGKDVDPEISQSALAIKGGVEVLVKRFLAGSKHVHLEIPLSELQFSSRIGTGTSASVFSGYYQGMPVAIKKFNKEYESMREEFVKEACLLSILKHPNLIILVGACTVSTPMCLLFELLPGNLHNYLLQGVEIPLDIKLRFVHSTAMGMEFLHRVGIMHRDLKCSNLLLTQGYQIKITDFGTAVPLRRGARLQDFQGTPPFISPELWAESQASYSADVYAFAIVVWQIAYQELPWKKLTLLKIAECVSSGMRPPLNTTCPLNTLIQACWAQDASARPCFTDVLRDLEVLRQRLLSSPTYGTPHSTHREDFMKLLLS